MSTATAAEVAAWMQAELERDGRLAQAAAVAGIRARFGATYAPLGCIRNDVLRAFRRLAPERKAYVGSTKAWRLREPGA